MAVASHSSGLCHRHRKSGVNCAPQEELRGIAGNGVKLASNELIGEHMRVMVISGTYPSERYPTPSIFTHNQVKALQKQGVDISVLEVDVRSIRRRRKLGFSFEVFDGVPVYRMAVPCGPVPFIMPLLFKLSAAYAVKRIIKRFGNPDIFHVHFGNTASYIAFLKRKYRIPMLVNEHSSAVIRGNRKRSIEKLFSIAYSNADAIVAVSNSLKMRMRELTEKEIIVVPNVLPAYFTYKQADRDCAFSFVSVGSFIESKRFDITIRAFSRLHSIYPNTKLKIAGEGVLKEKLCQIARENGVHEKVEFLGVFPNAKLPEIYNSCHCFVLPSMYETFGVVYAEALACGLPVIATKCGGPEDFVDGSNGLLIPVDDLEATVEAMKYVHENYECFDRESISGEIIRKLNEDAIGQAVCGVCSDMLEVNRVIG